MALQLSRHSFSASAPPARVATRITARSACAQASASHGSNSPADRRRLLLGAGLAAAAAAAPLLSSPLPAAAAAAAAASGQRAFFEIKVDGQEAGRIVVEILDAGIAGARFADLARGVEGVGYRRSRIELLEDNYIQDSGLKELSRRADGRSAIAGGGDTELLEEQLAAAMGGGGGRRHDTAGLVSLAVLPRRELASKDRLVAVGGKLVNVTETFGEAPNGTAFAITTAGAPELDATNLVVGRVVEGMDVVARLAALPRVKDNTSSPFFQAGKAAGDKRADVAERAFGKPFAKIVVERCGIEGGAAAGAVDL